MKTPSLKKSVIFAALVAAVGLAQGAEINERTWNWSPLGVSLAAPLQLPFMETDIYGLRFGGFLGINHDVYGVDCGVTEISRGNLAGVQGALFSWTSEAVYGLQVGAVANVAYDDSYGLQIGSVNVLWGDFTGLQIGGVNFDQTYRGLQIASLINWNNSVSYGTQISIANANQEDFYGFACGAVNFTSGAFTGFQLGCVNLASDMTGFQLGVFNACDQMHGVQIGVLNMITSSARLPIMVIGNASF